MNWILYGFKGVGKTHFGSRLGLPFIDTDHLIEEREGKSIRELVKEKTEPYFRKCEKEIILQLHVQGHVIAVGGGAVCDDDNLKHLHTLGTLIYLKSSKEAVKQKFLTPPLPTFLENGSFEKHYSTRIAKYEKIPSIWITIDNKSEQMILEELWQVINSETSFASPLGESLMAEL